MGLLSAGAAQREITPPVGVAMLGYANRDREACGVHDDLTVTAVVLGDGDTRAAVVTCDLVFLHPAMVSEIRSRAAAQADLAPEKVMLCCSHTHSGPATWHAVPGARDRVLREAYLDLLVDQISAAVVDAARDMRPAAWGLGRGQVEIGVNRRQRLKGGGIGLGANPGGLVDPELGLVRIDQIDAQGMTVRPLAVLVNHACHAVCLSSNNYAFSADWPGVTRRRIEEATGATVGFLQGACADINPRGGPQDTFDSALRLGELAAQEALRVYAEISLSRDVTVGGARRVLDLPLGGDPAQRIDFRDTASRVTGIPPAQVMDWLDERFPWAAEPCFPGPDEAFSCAHLEVQVLRLGDLALVGLAAEPFVEIGLEIKGRSSAAHTLLAGYANGSVGYLATPQAHREGGYEVNSSYVYYRLPGPLAPQCAGMVVSCALDMIASLA